MLYQPPSAMARINVTEDTLYVTSADERSPAWRLAAIDLRDLSVSPLFVDLHLPMEIGIPNPFGFVAQHGRELIVAVAAPAGYAIVRGTGGKDVPSVTHRRLPKGPVHHTGALVADDTAVYVGLPNGVQREGFDGTTVSVPGDFAKNLLVDADHLYWVEEVDLNDQHRILRAPRKTLAPVKVLAEFEADSDTFVLRAHGEFLYWTGDGGGVWKMPRAGGAIVKVAQAGGFDDDDFWGGVLAFDDEAVYWLSGEPGHRASDEDELPLLRACK